MEGRDPQGWSAPGAPPAEWPAPPGPAAPAARRRRRWPWVLGAGALLGVTGAGVGVALLLPEDDGDDAYCAALDGPARTDRFPLIVFLDPDLPEQQVAEVEALLDGRPEVADLVYVDREEAFADAMELFADEPAMQDLLRPEDIPTSFEMTTPDRASAEDLDDDLHDAPEIEGVEMSMFHDRPVRRIVDAVGQRVVEGGDGRRFGALLGGPQADRLRETAPDELADAVEVLAADLLVAGGELDQGTVDAARSVTDDAERRCP